MYVFLHEDHVRRPFDLRIRQPLGVLEEPL
jgi:hypothetical protein